MLFVDVWCRDSGKVGEVKKYIAVLMSRYSECANLCPGLFRVLSEFRRTRVLV